MAPRSTSNIPRKLNLEALRAQGLDALGTDPGITIELDNGDSVVIPHPITLDDAQQETVDKAEGARETARAILGAEVHKHFLAHGGRSNDVVLAWALLGKDMADPTSRK